MSNFSFSHSVFKRLVLQTRKKQDLFGKGLSCNVLSQNGFNMEQSKILLFGNVYPITFTGLSFMNSSTTSSQALSALLASSSSTLTTPTVTATNQNSSTSMPSIVNQVEQAPPSSQTTMTVSQSALSSSVDNTVAPDVAVPTQIKVPYFS